MILKHSLKTGIQLHVSVRRFVCEGWTRTQLRFEVAGIQNWRKVPILSVHDCVIGIIIQRPMFQYENIADRQ